MLAGVRGVRPPLLFLVLFILFLLCPSASTKASKRSKGKYFIPEISFDEHYCFLHKLSITKTKPILRFKLRINEIHLTISIYYPSEVRRGKYRVLGFFLLQYFPFVSI